MSILFKCIIPWEDSAWIKQTQGDQVNFDYRTHGDSTYEILYLRARGRGGESLARMMKTVLDGGQIVQLTGFDSAVEDSLTQQALQILQEAEAAKEITGADYHKHLVFLNDWRKRLNLGPLQQK